MEKSLEEILISIIKGRKGKLLSKPPTVKSHEINVECKNGHKWLVRADILLKGHWCAQCATNAKLSIFDMHRLAKERNGRCLSTTYKNTTTKLLWECHQGHTWEAIPKGLRSGRWCPICAASRRGATQRLTIEALRSAAKKKGGDCLSTKYINSKTKYVWKCGNGHTWRETYTKIAHRSDWCPTCSGRRQTIQDMKNVARERKGKFLSPKFMGVNKNHLWECSLGHQWKAFPRDVKNGNWCPTCQRGKSERICRAIFEELFQETFPPKRPAWLKRNNQSKLELDGYSQKLGLAFEYQGQQHYEEIPHFHRTRSLSEQRELDRFKAMRCKENSVILIEIPYTLSYEKIADYVVGITRKHGINPKKDPTLVNYRKLDVYEPKKLAECIEVAQSHAGRCLSTSYINAHHPMKWVCSKGHEFEAPYAGVVTRGTWCAICSGNAPLTIEEMKELAKKRGGECLSNKYEGIKVKLKWQCALGHQFMMIPSHVKHRGQWCPFCAGKRRTIQDLQVWAKKHEGKCLSERYLGDKSKHLWRCSNGHEWMATAGAIQSGRWCPECARLRRKRNLD